MKFVSKTFWNKVWSNYKLGGVNSVLFEDVFERYLTFNSKLRCIEIGCVPGNFLIFLHKRYGYAIYGVDYSDEISIVKENMKLNGVKKYKIFKEDFLSWRTSLRFDVVCSFGFIEHFANYEEVIEKHVSLLKPGGLLILTVPNFRYGRAILHILLRDFQTVVKTHNLDVMNPNVIKNMLEKNGLTILFSNYYQTFGFWLVDVELDNITIVEKVILWLIWRIQAFFTKFKINVPNKYFSPHIVCVARK
jgi:2-polyprenyl-3-methyl-5-hydroxy-6-metoxy-1,4-benzoquinol methylase